MTPATPCEHCHHEPSYRARQRLRAPYLGLWQAIIARIADLSPDVPVYRRDLDRWAVELWGEQPEAQPTFALATTRYERPLDEVVA